MQGVQHSTLGHDVQRSLGASGGRAFDTNQESPEDIRHVRPATPTTHFSCLPKMSCMSCTSAVCVISSASTAREGNAVLVGASAGLQPPTCHCLAARAQRIVPASTPGHGGCDSKIVDSGPRNFLQWHCIQTKLECVDGGGSRTVFGLGRMGRVRGHTCNTNMCTIFASMSACPFRHTDHACTHACTQPLNQPCRMACVECSSLQPLKVCDNPLSAQVTADVKFSCSPVQVTNFASS